MTSTGEILNGITKVQAGRTISIVVRNDGTLWTWGSSNTHGQMGTGSVAGGVSAVRMANQVLPFGDANVVSLALGGSYTIAADSNGDVWSWGNNMIGTLGIGSLGGDNSYRLTPAAIEDFNVGRSTVINNLVAGGPALPFVPGDVNRDGYVTAADVGMLRAYLAGFPVDICRQAADVTGTGTVTAADLALIRAYLAGFPVVLGQRAE